MKLSVILLCLVFMAVAVAGQTAAAPANKPEKDSATSKAKQDRWQGTIVRINKDQSTITVRGGQKNVEAFERQIQYDSSTQWTKQGKPAEQSEFKEGSFVIVLGQAGPKGVFHASRIDLRLPR